MLPALEDGGIGLDRTEYPAAWVTGGSEPGLLVLNHLARTEDGRVAVASIMLSNPNGAIDPNAAAEALALVRGGLELATTQSRSGARKSCCEPTVA